MERGRTVGGALVVLAITFIGCGQSAGVQTASVSPTDPAQAASTLPRPSVGPSMADTSPAAEANPQAPAEFTGRIRCGPPVPGRGGVSASLKVGEDGLLLTRYRGGAWLQTLTMSDPRLEGTIYQTYESDTYLPTGTEKGAEMFAATHRIENEAGVWESRSIGGAFADGTYIGESDRLEVWIGAGAYTGLVAIMEATPLEGACAFDVRGVIFAGGPVPVPYALN
jgi:hypothetical protein